MAADPALPPDPAATAGHATHAHLMPGMLTEDQLKQLDAARGKEFERLFLTFMIQHHRGAVTMVEELFSSQGAGLDDTVFKLASDISADQTSEIERMQRQRGGPNTSFRFTSAGPDLGADFDIGDIFGGIFGGATNTRYTSAARPGACGSAATRSRRCSISPRAA